MASSRIESVLESVSDGLRSIRAHKLRSFLTLTGIVFGVASVVSMFSIVAGIQEMVMSDFTLDGVESCFSFYQKDVKSELARDRVSQGVVFDDAAALSTTPEVAFSTALITNDEICQGTQEPQRLPVVGMEPDYFAERHMILTAGRSITALDLRERQRVAVIGKKAAEMLFGQKNPVGREFRLAGERFSVVGTVRPVRFRLIPENQSYAERKVFVPVTTLMAQSSHLRNVSQLQLKANSVEAIGPAFRDAEARLLQRHRGNKDYQPDNDAAEVAGVKAQVAKMLAGWNAVLGAIAVISLMIGGIGLFSIMQIAVRERVREIGIRKAVGASDADIRREFLAESLTLSTAGGIAGIVLGAGIIFIAEQVAVRFGKFWVIPISLPGAVIGLVFSALVGFLFGLYPASKASKLDPIEAIRE